MDTPLAILEPSDVATRASSAIRVAVRPALRPIAPSRTYRDCVIFNRGLPCYLSLTRQTIPNGTRTFPRRERGRSGGGTRTFRRPPSDEDRRSRRLGSHVGIEVRGVDVKTLDDERSASSIARGSTATSRCRIRARNRRVPRVQPPLRRRRAAPVEDDAHRCLPEITLLASTSSPRTARSTEDLPEAEGGTPMARTSGAVQGKQALALSVPSRGGQTYFASMYAAYDALPTELKQKLDGRIGCSHTAGRTAARALLNPEDRDWVPFAIRHPHASETDQGSLLRSGQDLSIEAWSRGRATRPRRAHRADDPPGTEYHHSGARATS